MKREGGRGAGGPPDATTATPLGLVGEGLVGEGWVVEGREGGDPLSGEGGKALMVPLEMEGEGGPEMWISAGVVDEEEEEGIRPGRMLSDLIPPPRGPAGEEARSPPTGLPWYDDDESAPPPRE